MREEAIDTLNRAFVERAARRCVCSGDAAMLWAMGVEDMRVAFDALLVYLTEHHTAWWLEAKESALTNPSERWTPMEIHLINALSADREDAE